MPTISRAADVVYTPSQMYQLVADIDAYPQFLPWCDAARVHEQSDSHQLASVSIGKQFKRSTFMTRNTLQPGAEIRLSLVDGPFKRLNGRWRFVPADSGGCRVLMDIDFEFSNRLLAAMVSPAFRRVTDTLVQAFVDRARQLYDSPPR